MASPAAAAAAAAAARSGARDGAMSVLVSYDAWGRRHVAQGQRLRPQQTTHPPRIYIDDASAASAPGRRRYSVLMIDRSASRPGARGGPLLIYVHYWAVVEAGAGSAGFRPCRVVRALAPYQPPAPHDALLHRYELFVFHDTPGSAPPAFLHNPDSRYISSLQQILPSFPSSLAATTYFIEQL